MAARQRTGFHMWQERVRTMTTLYLKDRMDGNP
jgi:hypothetical protein